MKQSVVLPSSLQQHWLQLLQAEQGNLLYQGLPIAVLGNLVLGVLLVYMQSAVIATSVLLAWSSVLFVLICIRLVLFLNFRRRDYTSQVPEYLLRQFRLTVFVAGLTWGTAGIFLFPAGNVPHQFFVAFVLAGITSAAVTSLAVDKIAAFLFIIPSLIPIAFNFIFEDTRAGYLMSIMVFFFTFFIVMSVIRLERDMHESTRLRVIADAQKQELALQQELNLIIAGAQTGFIEQVKVPVAFANIVNRLLTLTQSEYGFIGLVEYDEQGEPYLMTQAVEGIDNDPEAMHFYDSYKHKSLIFRDLENLFGWVMKNQLPIFSNSPTADVRASGIPDGRPPLEAFMGLPILFSGKMVAMLGLANRPSGYQQENADFLKPLLVVIGQLVNGTRVQAEHEQVQQELARTYELMERSNAVALIGTWRVDLIAMQPHWSSVTKAIHEVPESYECKLTEAMCFYKEGVHRDAITAAFNRAVTENIPYDVELIIVTAKGQERWVRAIGTPEFKQGVCQQVYGTFQDISERKRIDRVKSEFISTVSHELRTPLTSISASLGVMRSGKLGKLPIPVYKLVDIAHSNSLRLTHLINDLLDMDKLAAGKMNFNLQPQTVSFSIEQALQSNRAYADQYQVTLSFSGAELDSEIEIDHQRLQQVLANFLSNAIKFSPKGGQVVVNLSRVQGWLRIAVIDSGEGVPEVFKAHMFQKFSQADSSDIRQKGGTGLGLAITRELVECMNGRINFSSVQGVGATFYCEFRLLT